MITKFAVFNLGKLKGKIILNLDASFGVKMTSKGRQQHYFSTFSQQNKAQTPK